MKRLYFMDKKNMTTVFDYDELVSQIEGGRANYLNGKP
jgi:hypothetical protein